KSASYDPQRDSTVRVQVGKLRQKLDEYYREQGSDHRMRISVPKGAFRLQLEAKPLHVEQLPGGRPALVKYLVPVLACMAVALGGYMLGSRRAERTASGSPAAKWTPELRILWQPIVGNGMPIVVSYDVAMTIEMAPWKIRNPNINDPEEL